MRVWRGGRGGEGCGLRDRGAIRGRRLELALGSRARRIDLSVGVTRAVLSVRSRRACQAGSVFAA